MSRKTPKPDSSFDDSLWLDLFEPLFFAEDTSVADRAAKHFHDLLVELENGPNGVTNAWITIENGLRLIFPYTGMGRACMVLFQVSLGKDFPTKNDSLAVLSEARHQHGIRTLPDRESRIERSMLVTGSAILDFQCSILAILRFLCDLTKSLIYYCPSKEDAVNDAERTIKLDLRELPVSKTKRPVLVVLQGPSIGETVKLEKERTIIGRGSQADLVLRDEVASRQHAHITRLCLEADCVEYYLNDLESTNGTFLNGAKVSSQQLLQDGDKIKIGSHLIKYALLDEFEAEFQEKLHQMTQRDELTGLRSRRSLFAELDKKINEAAKLTDPPRINVLMMDIDFFKRVNDGHGHLIGSHTIRDVGHIVREVVGSADKAARYGGEEYMAYVVGSREQGFEIAEGIRKAVEAHQFPASTSDLNETMHICISLGVATFPDDGKAALEIVQKADQALFRAKLSGRNRTCVFDPEVDKPGSFHQAVDASAIIYGPADAQ